MTLNSRVVRFYDKLVCHFLSSVHIVFSAILVEFGISMYYKLNISYFSYCFMLKNVMTGCFEQWDFTWPLEFKYGGTIKFNLFHDIYEIRLKH